MNIGLAHTAIADERELIDRAQAGERAAFARLIEARYDFLFRLAWRWTGNRADAEDVAQEVCVRLARAIGSFRGEASFATFLHALTLNAVRDWGRRRARQKRIADAALTFAAIDTVGSAAAETDPAGELWEAVRGLPEKQRDAVLLVHGEGLSHADAAAAMGCSEKTVSWHIHEARKRLKRMLSSGGNGNENA
jgi:RNA polymerase sigma-70 factor (ECF subfamily)